MHTNYLKVAQLLISEKKIKKTDGWYLYSKDGSRKLGGPYKTEEEVNKRERQVQYFKNRK